MSKMNLGRLLSAVLVSLVICISSVSSSVGAIPTAGALFNNPYGAPEEQYRILDTIRNAIDETPSGATIRIAMYSLDLDPMVDTLIAAKNRGVNIKYVTDDHFDSPQLQRLTAALGKTVTTGTGSFVKICDYGCTSDQKTTDASGNLVTAKMHAKYLSFTATGGMTNVAMITSSNFTMSQAIKGWNNLYTVIGNSTVSSFLKSKFELMTKDSNITDPYATTSSGINYLYFFARKPGSASDTSTDTYYTILKNIKCTGLASGYGTNGKTDVAVSMFQWTSARKYLADRLWTLKNSGCNVRVNISLSEMTDDVLAVLKKPTAYGQIDLKTADVDADSDTLPEKYSHNKYILINGYYSGSSTRVVFTGSPNFSTYALRYNNELAIRLKDATLYQKYLENFNTIDAQSTSLISSNL